MNTTPAPRPAAAFWLFGILAVATGLIVSLLEPKWAVAGIAGALAVGLVLYDYRVGAVCLTFLLPWFSSPLVPQTRGFNLINFLIVASVASLAMKRAFGGSRVTLLPKPVVWCYVVPILIGTLLALPHLPQAAANFPGRPPDFYQPFVTGEFLKTRIIKPLFFVVYAILLANAARDSRKPERLLWAFGVSAVLPAVAIMVVALLTGGSVEQRGTYLEGLGLHPNSYGMLLVLAAGPLLFLTVGSAPKPVRLASGLALIIVALALLLTGSRGAALAFAVVIGVWLFRRKRLSDLIVATVVVAVAVLFIPDRVWDRLTMGLDNIGATHAGNMDDPLTKGRLASWALLLPDVLLSPIWGQGIVSVAWNKATTAGQYFATLSHNMYIDMVLDLGIAGFIALMYLFFRYARGFKTLSNAADVSPVMRDYFSGAFASFLGMLVMGMTNGYYMPHPEQAYLWFALGMLYANWAVASRVAPQPTPMSRYRRRHGVVPGRRTRFG